MPDEDFDAVMDDIALDSLDLPPGEKAILSLQLPAEFIIIFEPVTHSAQFIDVKGEPTQERQALSLVYRPRACAQPAPSRCGPGPLRITLENRTDARVLPGRLDRRRRAARHAWASAGRS